MNLAVAQTFRRARAADSSLEPCPGAEELNTTSSLVFSQSARPASPRADNIRHIRGENVDPSSANAGRLAKGRASRAAFRFYKDRPTFLLHTIDTVEEKDEKSWDRSKCEASWNN